MKTLRKLSTIQKALSCFLMAGTSLVLCSGADAQLVDDYEGPLTGYTGTVILDVNGGASNTSTFEIVGGELGLTTTSFDAIEQHAFIRDGLALFVGQEVQLDLTLPLGGGGTTNARNFGLYVGGTAPTTGVREDYISLYGQTNNEQIFQRGFEGDVEYANLLTDATGGDTIFIARTGVNEFETGYYVGGTRITFGGEDNDGGTLIPSVPNTADFVGIYADVRENGTVGFGDNLRIAPIPSAIPEPGSLAVLGMGAMLVGLRRRR